MTRMTATWAAIVGICTAVSGSLSVATSALPHSFAYGLTIAGFALTLVDRVFTALENMSATKANATKKGA